jgi:heme exporter protein D
MQQWQSWSHFWNMDGYGLYIWGSYGVTLACMLAEPLLAVRRRRAALEQALQQDDEAH